MVLITIIYAISTFVIISFIWWYYNLFKFRKLDKIPGPKPWPFVGSATEMGSTPCELLENLQRFTKIYGNVCKVFIGLIPKIIISNADLIEEITQSNIHITKSDGYDLLKPWINDGLLVSTGLKWKSRRKLITPSFHFKIIDDFTGIFNKNCAILVEKLRENVGKSSVDLVPLLNLYSLDVICETSMGQEMNSQKNENSVYVRSVRRYLDIFIVRFFSSWKRYPLLFKLSRDYKDFLSSLKILENYSSNVIKTREQTFKNDNKNSEGDDLGIKKKMALLDMLLEQKNNNRLTLEDLREEIDTFIFEGHDTVTAGSSFALYALANHPEIQNKLYEEITQELPSDGENLSTQQLNKLQYLDMVVKESLRLYPPAPLVERQLQEDFTIGGQTFPKGTILLLYIYGMHNSEKYFPEPKKFNPERFAPENAVKRHKFAYLPFSAGPRNCIGQRYAITEMKLTIVKILQNFELSPVPGFKPKIGMSATLQSYNGLHVRIKSRSK